MNTKVDRAIQTIVIDWLQFGDKMDEDRAQNTLTLIAHLESELAQARTEVERLRIDYDTVKSEMHRYREKWLKLKALAVKGGDGK